MSDSRRAGGPRQVRAITEQEWFDALTGCEPLHQWGPAFLHEETAGGRVCVYVRDDSGQGRHACVRLDAVASGRARAGVEAVEVAARQAADVISFNQAKPSLSTADMAEEQEASRVYTDTADALYRELLAGA